MRDQIQVLSEEAKLLFSEGIALVLSRWSALQLAVNNEWGGRNSCQKADQIHSDIFSWFILTTEPLYIDDLEEKLYGDLISLDTVVKDGSIEEVAEKLMIMHEECLNGNFSSIEVLRESNHLRVPVAHVRQRNDEDDSDDDDDDDENMNEGPGSISNNASSKIMVGSSKFVSNSNSEDMEVDKPMSKPSAEAEDGWEVVGPKRGRGRKN